MILFIKNFLRQFILFCLVSNSYSCFSQEKDAGLWENLSLTKKLTRNYTFHFDHEGRISNNVSQFYYLYGDFGITRNLTKHFKMELDYVLAWKKNYIRENWRHQWYTALFFKEKFFKRLELELRSMYQQQYEDIYSSDVGRYPANYLRNKITLTYIFAKYPFYHFDPYIAIESYYHLDNNNKYGPQFDRIRYFLGVYYKFNKSNSLEFYYLIENNFNTDGALINYVSGIGYEHTF